MDAQPDREPASEPAVDRAVVSVSIVSGVIISATTPTPTAAAASVVDDRRREPARSALPGVFLRERGTGQQRRGRHQVYSFGDRYDLRELRAGIERDPITTCGGREGAEPDLDTRVKTVAAREQERGLERRDR